jgi:hypothetical protein
MASPRAPCDTQRQLADENRSPLHPEDQKSVSKFYNRYHPSSYLLHKLMITIDKILWHVVCFIRRAVISRHRASISTSDRRRHRMTAQSNDQGNEHDYDNQAK